MVAAYTATKTARIRRQKVENVNRLSNFYAFAAKLILYIFYASTCILMYKIHAPIQVFIVLPFVLYSYLYFNEKDKLRQIRKALKDIEYMLEKIRTQNLYYQMRIDELEDELRQLNEYLKTLDLRNKVLATLVFKIHTDLSMRFSDFNTF